MKAPPLLPHIFYYNPGDNYTLFNIGKTIAVMYPVA